MISGVTEVDGEHERMQQASEIRELAAHIHAAEARLATMVNDFTADGMWNASGDWRSVTNWLTTNCAYTPAAASRLASVAKRVDTMPEVMGHARNGRISLSVAATIAAVVTPDTDHQFATIATNASPTQTARMVALYRDQTKTSPDDSGDAETDFWRTWSDRNNRWRVNGSLPPEIGALIDEAFEASRTATNRTDTHSDDDKSNRSNADAVNRHRPPIADIMRAFAEHALNTARDRRLHREGGEHFGVTVLIDLETLVTGTLRPTSICKLESGPHVTPGLVRRLAEEGWLQVLMHQAGTPLWIGHKIRFANRHQRRALRFRDGGCAVPGCAVTRRLHAHHIEHWPAGPTDIDNLVLLCSFHHRMIHHNNWTVTTTGNQHLEFRDSRGQLVGNRLNTSQPPPGPIEHLPDQQALDIDRWTAKPNPCGDPLTDWAANVWLHALLTAA